MRVENIQNLQKQVAELREQVIDICSDEPQQQVAELQKQVDELKHYVRYLGAELAAVKNQLSLEYSQDLWN